ncbi:MAG: hypothetical protein OIF48_16720 [Silicimonas sp.]|nr:hypothetical protein [Silicimonas sp.]
MSDERDPKGLIRESFRIEGISAPECRSIFLDWAISVPNGVEPAPYLRALIEEYRPDFPDHPMITVLEGALQPPTRTGRRGGAMGRRS